MEESPRSARYEVLPPEGDEPGAGTRAGRHGATRRQRRARRRAARRRRLLIIGLSAVALWSVMFAAGLVQGARAPVALPSPPPIPATPTTIRRPVPMARALTVYPYSVVAGGVRSVDEVRAAIARDVVVAAHYAGFRVADARPGVVSRARRVHVSYRIGDRVYWTRRTVALTPGEAVVTDGTTEIRARCGNRIADEVLGETSEAEPAVEVFDLPILVARDLAPEPVLSSRPFAPPLLAPLSWPGPGPVGGTRQNPPGRVPEPGTLVLLALGAGALAARALLKPGR